MKSKEELNVLKEEVETMNKKLLELTDEELENVGGGEMFIINMYRCQKCDRIFNRRGYASYVICECGGSARRCDVNGFTHRRRG